MDRVFPSSCLYKYLPYLVQDNGETIQCAYTTL